MDDPLDLLPDDKLKSASRRNFIKGVIAGGVAASSANYHSGLNCDPAIGLDHEQTVIADRSSHRAWAFRRARS
jgi:hypothetical protein